MRQAFVFFFVIGTVLALQGKRRRRRTSSPTRKTSSGEVSQFSKPPVVHSWEFGFDQVPFYPGKPSEQAMEALLALESTKIVGVDKAADECLGEGAAKLTGVPAIGVTRGTTQKEVEASAKEPHLVRLITVNNVEIRRKDRLIIVHFHCPLSKPQRQRSAINFRMTLENPGLTNPSSIPSQLAKDAAKQKMAFPKIQLKIDAPVEEQLRVFEESYKMPVILIIGRDRNGLKEIISVTLKVPAPKQLGDTDCAFKAIHFRKDFSIELSAQLATAHQLKRR